MPKIDDEHRADGMQAGVGDRSRLSRAELSNRASKSVFVVSAWGLTALLIGFFGNLALARLLDPHAFGVFAIGTVVVLVANGIAEAGLGPGLIRRPEPPTVREFQEVTGFQLVVTSLFAAGIAAVGLQFGQAGAVAAVMAISMPIAVVQTPGRVIFARRLVYERVAVVEAAGVIAFYAWTITTVKVFELGVWGLATGAVVKACAGTIAIWTVSELGPVRPARGRWADLKPLVWFGIRIQAAWLVIVGRDLVVNAVAAAIVGVTNLGLWSLARRLMEVPLVFFDSLWRVTFPGMSHVLAREENAAPIIEKMGRIVPVVASFALAAFVGVFSSLVPSLFGEQWSEVSEILPWAAVGLLIGGSVSVATVGYLQAADHPEDTVIAAVCFAVVWIGTTAALLPIVGITGVAMGWVTGAAAEAITLDRAARRRSGARVLRGAAAPLAVGVTGCAVAGVLALSLSPGIVTAAVAAGAGMAVTLAGMAIVCRPALRDGGDMIVRAGRLAFSGRIATASPSETTGLP
jgi:polysaccharide transporter, PST family